MKFPKWFSSKSSTLDIFREVYGGGRTSKAGVDVTYDRALHVSTVLACVRVLANGVSQVSWPVLQDVSGARRKATEHPVYRVLNGRPNRYQTAFDFRRTMVFHLALTGNFFAWKGMVGSRRELRTLEPIEPGRVSVEKKTDGSLIYRVRADNGLSAEFTEDQIWHIRAPSWNGWMGMDATKLAREAIGLAIATETAHAEQHKGSPRIGGIYALKNPVGMDKFKSLAAWLDQHSEGGARAGKPLIIDDGATYNPLSMTGVDAEHLATREHQVVEICRGFGVLPIMIGHSDKTTTYASAEQMFLAHNVHTMMPLYSMIEQSANQFLLSERDLDEGYYTKFNANAMMRGAAKDRAEFYAKALGAGGHGTAYMVPNEVRALEDLDPIEGGDKLPVGVVPAKPDKTKDDPDA